mgnify:CR=1 FL=1
MDIKLVNIGFGNIVAANRIFLLSVRNRHRLNVLSRKPAIRACLWMQPTDVVLVL